MENRAADIVKKVLSAKNTGIGNIILGKGMVDTSLKRLSSGVPSLDYVTGGGYPFGRITEIIGDPSSGKTTICLHAIAATQKQGNVCAYIDSEHSCDPTYAKNLGVDFDNLIFSQPDYGEQAIETAIYLIDFMQPGDLIVIDSVAALTPKKELEGTMEDTHVGLQARLMSQAMRKITGVASQKGVRLLFTNQYRNKIGVMYGSPKTTPGGEALKFYASIRIEVARVATLKDKEGNNIGGKTRLKAIKNKVASPFKEIETEIYYGQGIPYYNDLAIIGEKLGIIQRKGSWFSYGETKLGQGLQSAVRFLEENHEVSNTIIKIMYETLGYTSEN